MITACFGKFKFGVIQTLNISYAEPNTYRPISVSMVTVAMCKLEYNLKFNKKWQQK